MEDRVTLHSCVEKQDLEELKILLEENVADIEAVEGMIERTALHCAVLEKWEAGVNLLLERGANVDAKDAAGSTPLHMACFTRHHEIIDLLLDFGANVNSTDIHRQTPLHMVSCSEDVPLVEKLLRRGAEINCQDEYGNTPLALLRWTKSIGPMFECYLSNGADLDIKNNRGNSRLLNACRYGDIDQAKTLINRKANVHSKDTGGNSVLHFASCLESDDIARLLLEAGSKLECRNNDNETPLLFSLRYLYGRYYIPHHGPNNQSVICFLIQRGAEVNVMGDDRITPLVYAMCARKLFLFKTLLVNGSEVNVRNKKRNTPLHSACRLRSFETPRNLLESVECVRQLLVYGAEVNARNQKKETPLHVASRLGNEEVITLLLKEGADVNCKDKHGNTPLLQFLHKRSNGGTDICSVAVFLKYDADVNVCNNKMDTPLIYAALHQNHLAVEELLSANADVNAKTCYGDTPLHLACRRSNIESVEKLLAAGADINLANNQGDTPLHAASQSWCGEEVYERLLSRNPKNVNHKNNWGETALHLTAPGASLTVVKALLLGGCNVNDLDREGNSPLHWFFGTSYDYLILRELLAWGASVSIRNQDGITPLGLLSKCDRKRTVGNEIKRYIILSKAANISLESPLDVNFHLGFDHLAEFEDECLLEIDRMKARKIGTICAFDILSKIRDPSYVLKFELKDFVDALDQNPSEFPIYSSLLISTYRRAKIRLTLMNKAQSMIQLPLPNEMLRKILTYVEDRHLEVFSGTT